MLCVVVKRDVLSAVGELALRTFNGA